MSRSLSGRLAAFLEAETRKPNPPFPGCVLVRGRPGAGREETVAAGRRGLTRNVGDATPALVYDLASLTKVLATTTMLMISVDRGLLRTSDTLGEIFFGAAGPPARVGPPEPSTLSLTVERLLTHQSGLPPWRPYHDNPALAGRGALLEALLNEPPLSGPGEATVYSDLNFLLLGLVLEELWGRDLAALFNELVAAPLGLASTGYLPDPGRLTLAPTEDGFRPGGPPDYPGVPVRGPVPLGRPHDDNAAALGGAAGHAGLFGTAGDVWKIIGAYSLSLAGAEGALVKRGTAADFLTPRRDLGGAPGRALGFDVGSGPLEGALGHLGYTGGSFWWDPVRRRAFVFLCNRVHPTARGSQMGRFRLELADMLWGGDD